MSYYISIKTHCSFDQAVDRITKALETEGFGILTEIDVKATLKKKLDVDFKNYKILGACNPHYAYQAFQAEDKIGILMPCNVTVIEQDSGKIEISVMDPTKAMHIVENEELESFALAIKQKLERCLVYFEEEEP